MERSRRPDDPVDALVPAVRQALATAADPEKAPAMQAYMKSAMPFRGVTATPLARVCRTVFDSSPLPDESAWRRAVLGLWDGAAFREERYAAIALTGHRGYRAHQRPEALDLYRHLVVTGAWWDLVDPVASNRVGPILRGWPDEVLPVMRAWAVAEDLWLRRTAIVCQLQAKGATDVGLLRFAVEQNLVGTAYGGEFFVRKAIGWALRQHARTDEDWVVGLVDELGERLSPLSRREALKHVRRPE